MTRLASFSALALAFVLTQRGTSESIDDPTKAQDANDDDECSRFCLDEFLSSVFFPTLDGRLEFLESSFMEVFQDSRQALNLLESIPEMELTEEVTTNIKTSK